MNRYSIGPAVAADIPPLREVELAAAALFPAGALPPGCGDAAVPEEALRAAREEERLWVARRDGRPVGFLLLEIVDGDALVAEVDVHPEHGRRGLGGRLVAEAMAYARDRGFPALYLTTFRRLAWNAPFYLRLGFEIPDEDDLPPAVRAILEDERQRGFVDRAAMRWKVPERDPGGRFT